MSSPAPSVVPNRFAGKVVIITGSSSGIGQATAVRFAQEGASVTIHGRSAEGLTETQKLILATGAPADRILIVTGTLEDEAVHSRLIDDTVAKFGKLDVLVNNAGFAQKPGSSDTYSLEAFDSMFAVNVRAVYHLIQLAAPHLTKTHGNIVNIGSSVSKSVSTNSVAYSVSKAALDHITRNFAVLLGPKGVRVNSVNPGITRTNFADRAGFPQATRDSLYTGDLAKTLAPLGRSSSPNEQAEVILFTASDAASYVHGSIIFVDGGFILQPAGAIRNQTVAQ